MKSTKIISGMLVIAVVILCSCAKEADTTKAEEISDFSNKALVQVYNATISSGGSLIAVDNAPVNGVTAMSYAGAFPSSSYFMASPGLRAFTVKASSSSSAQLPTTFSENFDAAKHYNIFMYDTLTSPKHITVPTIIETPSDNTARLRLANFIYSKTAVPAVDIFSVKQNMVIFSNVQTTQVTDFISFPTTVTDTLVVRETNTTNSLATMAFIPTPKRTYTLVFRGRYQTTSGTIARTLSSQTNF